MATNSTLRVDIPQTAWTKLAKTSIPIHLETWQANGWAEIITDASDGIAIVFTKQLWADLSPTKIPQIAAEDDDSFSNEVLLINQIIGAKTQLPILIDNQGFMGEASFKLVVTISGGNPRQLTDSVTPLDHMDDVGGPLPVQDYALIRALQNSSRNQSSFLTELSAFKLVGLSHPGLYDLIRFSDFLERIDVSRIKTFKPIWKKTPNGHTLKYVATAIKSDGSTEDREIDPEDLDPCGAFVSQGSRRYVVLTDDESKCIDFARATKRNQSPEQVASTEADPNLLLPNGTDPNTLDLCNYNPRVVGFEVLRLNSKIEFSSSGVSWYQKDTETGGALNLVQENGETVSLKVADSKTLGTLIDHFQRELSSVSRNAGYTPKAIAIDEKLVKPTQGLLDFLVRVKSLHDGKKQPQEKTDTSSTTIVGGREAAMLDGKDTVAKPFSNSADPLEIAHGLKHHRDRIALEPFQAEGVSFLIRRFKEQRGGVLIADDMGLGKTIQLLTFIAAVRSAIPKGLPTLVVTPPILVHNWQKEISKFFHEGTFGNLLVLTADTLKQFKLSPTSLNTSAIGKSDFILTNYPTLSGWQKSLLTIDFGIVVFDESQGLKNPNSNQSRAARGLKSEFTICSTGTPVENRLRDLWTQVDSLQRIPSNPLGKEASFKATYEAATDGVKKAKQNLSYPGPDSLVIRREKTILRNFPKKTLLYFPIPMTREQEALEEELVGLGSKDTFRILQNLQKLYQHPTLLSPSSAHSHGSLSVAIERLIAESPKLSWLVKTLEEISKKGERVLIFTLWCRMQDIIAEVIRFKFDMICPIINGETNRQGPQAVDEILNRFSAHEGFAPIVLSPLAAGSGLNISAANHVIHYGRWWNPAKEDQASDRAYRKGQTKDVFVYYPILHSQNDDKKGFDMKLHELVERKRNLARDFLSPSNEAEPTASELHSILKESN